MEEYLILGTIIGSFALDGTLKVFSTTNNQELRYQKGNVIYMGEEKKPLTVISYRPCGNIDFIKVKEVTTKEDAETLKGSELYSVKNVKDLKEGYYFFSDLVGCTITNENNNEIGIVTKVEEYPAQATLRAKAKDGKEFLVPFVKEFILSVNIEQKTIKIKVIEGLL